MIACHPICRFSQYEPVKFQATVDRNEAFRTLQWDGVSELNETPSHHDIEIQGIPMKRPSHLIAIFAFQFSFCLASIHGQEAKREPMVPEQGTKFTPIQIDTTGDGWIELGKDDFQRANCDEATWTWDGPLVHCTGKPVGVLRSKKKYKNLEFVGWWRHLSFAGNSGFFLWTPDSALENLPPNRLPDAGIEVQVLDTGYTEQYEKSSGKKATWFTTHGDIFPVGRSKLKPFPPLSPDGSRSFPKGNFSKPSPEWNFYYVRAINGEVRLWVNGHEVSGGAQANPAEGYLCLESEGAPVEFRNIRVRELP